MYDRTTRCRSLPLSPNAVSGTKPLGSNDDASVGLDASAALSPFASLLVGSAPLAPLAGWFGSGSFLGADIERCGAGGGNGLCAL